MRVPEHEVFGQLYFSDAWQRVFAVDHSFIVWGTVFVIAVWLGRTLLRAFAGAGFLHAVADFLTHHDDARRQFWPVSDWVFQSPVSYWDVRFYGNVFAYFEVGLVTSLTVMLCWRMKRLWQRGLVLVIASLIILPFILAGNLHGLHGMG
jgi:hypothetical protein